MPNELPVTHSWEVNHDEGGMVYLVTTKHGSSATLVSKGQLDTVANLQRDGREDILARIPQQEIERALNPGRPDHGLFPLAGGKGVITLATKLAKMSDPVQIKAMMQADRRGPAERFYLDRLEELQRAERAAAHAAREAKEA